MPFQSVFQPPVMAKLSSASINFAGSGDNTLVAGVALQTIRIFKVFFVCSAATNVLFKDGASTNLTGSVSVAANGAVVLDYDGEPWFVTAAGNGFVLNQSSTAQISGRVYYTQS